MGNAAEPAPEQDEKTVQDDTENDDTVAAVQYEITSFGADYDAEGLVKRLQRDDIFIPPFQRAYVWTMKEASRFIESLLLGLPVPGVFLARESDTKRLLVIDGQQRLRTLQFFFEGYFDPDPDAQTKRVFRLLDVQPQFKDRTYGTLEEKDRIILNDSILHATIVKQENPKDDEASSIYHIFERLNTSGRKLSPQQIRVAIYHGKFIGLLRNLNSYEPWRAIFGRKSKSLKDQELILRFLALYFQADAYYRPMNEFLNAYTNKHRNCDDTFCEAATLLFQKTISLFQESVGQKAFRPEYALNAAVFDSSMVGLAKRMQGATPPTPATIAQRYNELLADIRYRELFSQSTSDEKNVAARLDKAIRAFSAV